MRAWETFRTAPAENLPTDQLRLKQMRASSDTWEMLRLHPAHRMDLACAWRGSELELAIPRGHVWRA